MSASFVPAVWAYEVQWCGDKTEQSSQVSVIEQSFAYNHTATKNPTVELVKMMISRQSVHQLESVQAMLERFEERIPSTDARFELLQTLKRHVAVTLWQKSAPWSIVDVAVASEQFPTLVAAVQAADLVDVLATWWPFTVFAPTEEAFAALLNALELSAEELLANTELLTSVLTYHVLPGIYIASDVVWLSQATMIETVQWASVTINSNNGQPTIDNAAIVGTDIFGSNGVIHVIDEVILPPL